MGSLVLTGEQAGPPDVALQRDAILQKLEDLQIQQQVLTRSVDALTGYVKDHYAEDTDRRTAADTKLDALIKLVGHLVPRATHPLVTSPELIHLTPQPTHLIPQLMHHITSQPAYPSTSQATDLLAPHSARPHSTPGLKHPLTPQPQPAYPFIPQTQHTHPLTPQPMHHQFVPYHGSRPVDFQDVFSYSHYAADHPDNDHPDDDVSESEKRTLKRGRPH